MRFSPCSAGSRGRCARRKVVRGQTFFGPPLQVGAFQVRAGAPLGGVVFDNGQYSKQAAYNTRKGNVTLRSAFASHTSYRYSGGPDGSAPVTVGARAP